MENCIKEKKNFLFFKGRGEFIWIKSWVFKRSVFENFKLHFVPTSPTSFSSHCQKWQITCVISTRLEKEQLGPRIVFHFINTNSTNPWKDTINKFCLLIREKNQFRNKSIRFIFASCMALKWVANCF